MSDNFDEFISILENANSNFEEECEKTLDKVSAIFLRKTIQRTPVGKIRGGTLRRSWKLAKTGKYQRTMSNNVKYGIYVEYPHRTRGGKGIVEGRYMLKRSFTEVEAEAEKEFKDMLDNLLKG